MPQGEFYDMGKDPKKMNDMGMEDKIMYPSVMVSPEDFPPMMDMKMGDTGEALIRYKISKHGGLDITAMKHIGMADPKAEADKKKLLDRHKKDQMKQSSEPTADADSGGGYGGM